MSARPRARGIVERRLDAALGTLLLLAICVVANRLARDHLALRRDFSQDRLYSLAGATRGMLAELEDLLAVEAYFTGEARHAAVQVAKGRLVDQLRELEVAARGRLEVRLFDPNASSEAQLAASRHGITTYPLQGFQGSARVSQDVYLGLVLRYRGREQVIPFVLPQNLEYAFAAALRRLVRERPLCVGFLTGADARFQMARDLVAVEHRALSVDGLADGARVPDEVDVLVVARPVELHPRAAFAIDQFVQRGGRAILLVDGLVVDARAGSARRVATGLEALLAAWGAPLSGGLVFDLACNVWSVARSLSTGAGETRVRDRVEYPYWPRVAAEGGGLAEGHPVTASLPGASLFWASALLAAADPPPGVVRTDLLSSSARAWLVPPLESLAIDAEMLGAQAIELLAQSPSSARRRALAVVLEGRLPSAFAGGAPAPRDPIAEALAREARERGEELPPGAAPRTDEPVLSAERDARVVVFGDSDWAADGNTFTDENRVLFSNVVDWMGLEGELVALRSRIPRQRRIADFLAEERAARNVAPLAGSAGWSQAEALSRLDSEAHAAAARRRYVHMLAALCGSLAGFGLLAAAARAARRIGREQREARA